MLLSYESETKNKVIGEETKEKFFSFRPNIYFELFVLSAINQRKWFHLISFAYKFCFKWNIMCYIVSLQRKHKYRKHQNMRERM